jgi:hypothetical protein
VGVLIDLPRPEHFSGELEAVLAELFLGGESLGVGERVTAGE